MDTTFNWNGKLIVPHALLLDHDAVRTGFVRAMMAGGPIARAAERVAHLCLPHFEYEEKSVFPVLALLPHMAFGNLRPEMMDAMPLISDFTTRYEALASDHQSILDSIVEMLHTAHKVESREFARFAYNLRVHEWIEDEVIYPAVILIGRHLRERFDN